MIRKQISDGGESGRTVAHLVHGLPQLLGQHVVLLLLLLLHVHARVLLALLGLLVLLLLLLGRRLLRRSLVVHVPAGRSVGQYSSLRWRIHSRHRKKHSGSANKTQNLLTPSGRIRILPSRCSPQ